MAAYSIALYIRLSLEDEKYDSMSIQSQQLILHQKAELLDEYMDAEVKEYIDNGYTGTNFERPAMQELLENVRAGKVNCIIVKDLSRFGRNSIETGYFIEKVFPLYHIRFISVSDNFDTSTLKGDTGGMEIAFKYLINECYSRDMSRKTKSAKYARMRRGEYQSSICPYGYQKGSDGKMIPDPETADNVKMIFEWAADGISAGQITNKLFELHIPTPGEHKASKGKNYHDVSRSNGVWSTSTVLKILADEQYIGTYICGKTKVAEIGSRHMVKVDESKWIKIPDHHTPIISKELYEQAKSKIRRFTINKQQHEYPLRGKVVCGCCDHAMGIRNDTRFACKHSERIPQLECYNSSIKIKELENAVLEILKSRILSFSLPKDKNNVSCNDEAEQGSDRLRSLQERKRTLYEQLVSSKIDMESYKTQKAELDRKIIEEKSVEETVNRNSDNIGASADYTKLKKVCDDLKTADTLTVSITDALVDKIYVFPDNRVEVKLKYLELFS